MEYVQASIEAEACSGGLVTPAILDSLMAAGYHTSFDQLARSQPADLPQEHQPFPMQAVQSQPESRLLRLPSGLSLDFGGIAKGWAAHQAIQHARLRTSPGGCGAISPSAGSGGGGHGWWYRDPQPAESLGTLRNQAAAVSPPLARITGDGNRAMFGHHIIDRAETGRDRPLSVTVIAPTSGSRDGRQSRPDLGAGGIAGWIGRLLVTNGGQVVYGHAFEKYLRELN
jgi:thiamine biosynthesis lipoprotein